MRFRADAPAELGMRMCSDGVALVGLATFCNDQIVASAVRHCRATCSLCAGAPAPPSDDGDAAGDTAVLGTTTAPWPGGPNALKLRVTVRTWTGMSSRVVVARLEQLQTSTSFYFIQMLVKHLQDVGFAEMLPPATQL